MKKKISAAMVLAMVLTLVLLGAAVAASLGVFGRFAEDETNGQKLQHYENVSQAYGETQTTAPLAEDSVQVAAATDVYSQILEHQRKRTFGFTLEQAHFNGRTIAISYTLQKDSVSDIVLFGEGMPTGEITWQIEKQGKANGSNLFGNLELNQQIADYLNAHESAYVLIDFASLGDGFFLSDGSALNISDSGSKELADGRVQGYGEYEGIPQAYQDADSVDAYLHILYGTEIIYQDATGYKEAVVMNPEDRGIKDIPITILRDGKTVTKTGGAAFETYSVKAELTVSQVEIAAVLTIQCPEEWSRVWTEMGAFKASDDYVYDYALYADGKLCGEAGSSVKVIAPALLELSLRYNLPASFQELILRPVYMQGGEKAGEDIVIR